MSTSDLRSELDAIDAERAGAEQLGVLRRLIAWTRLRRRLNDLEHRIDTREDRS